MNIIKQFILVFTLLNSIVFLTGCDSNIKSDVNKKKNQTSEYFLNEPDYIPNIKQLFSSDPVVLIGNGYKFKTSFLQQSSENPDNNFIIIDNMIRKSNITSLVFRYEELGYIVGVAASCESKTGTIGFIGDFDNEVSKRYQAGFVSGAKYGAKNLDKNIKILIQYTGDFSSPDKGRIVGKTMYTKGADIIFNASQFTGNGLLQETKYQNEAFNKKVWVINDEKSIIKNNSKKFILTSATKNTESTIKQLVQKSQSRNFNNGQFISYGLKEGFFNLTDGKLSSKTKNYIKIVKRKIISGEIQVPHSP